MGPRPARGRFKLALIRDPSLSTLCTLITTRVGKCPIEISLDGLIPSTYWAIFPSDSTFCRTDFAKEFAGQSAGGRYGVRPHGKGKKLPPMRAATRNVKMNVILCRLKSMIFS
jgi:hypothetical protein